MSKLRDALLRELQFDFPLTSLPFRKIASRLRTREEAVVRTARRLRDSGFIGYIGAAFNLDRLGFKSTLVCMRVPAASLARAISIVNSYPHVSHNYLRAGDYNLWFTVTAPSGRALARVVGEIRERTGIRKMLDLKTRRVYKIDTRIKGGSHRRPTPPRAAPPARAGRKGIPGNAGDTLSELATPLEIEERPFRPKALRLGISEKRLCRIIGGFMRRGVIRRFGAFAGRAATGGRGNALVAWRIDARRTDAAARTLASFDEVSHCYLRDKAPSWPFSLYTMVHAPHRKACAALVRRMAEASGIRDCKALFTERELKKSRLDPAELMRWEARGGEAPRFSPAGAAAARRAPTRRRNRLSRGR